jgi:hypothetical protein
MNVNLITILKQIAAEHGNSIFSKPKRVSVFLADLAQDVPKPQKNALLKCLEQGYSQILENIAESEQAHCKQRLAQRLHEEEGLDPGLCGETLELLATVLYGVENQENSSVVSSATIPNGVQTIGEHAFSDKQLTSVIIPDSVTNIGSWAFCHNQLTSITIPKNVNTIGSSAFSDNQLISVIIPDSVRTIGENAFAHNQLTGVTIPNNVTLIENGAFQDNQLANVVISGSVTSIGKRAFQNNQLVSIIIPKSVTIIDEYAFLNNFLVSVTISVNVDISKTAFDNKFFLFYSAQGRRAGTYIFNNGKWGVQ